MDKQLKVSQKTLMEHSEVKLLLLKNYMGAYLNILSRASGIQEIHLFDLFSGPGIYSNGGKGSPMILLDEIAQTTASISNRAYSSTTFHCLFNDHNQEKINELKGHVAQSTMADNTALKVRYENTDYREVLETVVSTFKNMKSSARGFAFVDPYGYKEIKLDDIKRMLAGGKSEVLLFLPAQFMFRFRENGTPESLKTFLTDVLPHGEIDLSKGSVEFIDQITEGFRAKLGDKHFVDSFIIAREKNQFFCLFFFTSNILGFQKMLEAKWRIDKEDGRGWTTDSQGSLFTSLDKPANTGKLKDLLREFIDSNGKTNNQIREFALHHGYLPTHVNDVLTDRKGALMIESLDGGKATSFYIGDSSRNVLIKKK